MSIVQDVALKDFLGGAFAALEKAQSGEFKPEERPREIPEKTFITTTEGGEEKERRIPATTITEYVNLFPGHEIVRDFGDFTSDFKITIPKPMLEKLPEPKRETMGKIILYSEFIATGERGPALLVPPELEEAANELFQKAGIKKTDHWNPHDKQKNYSVTSVPMRDGGEMKRFNFGFQSFKELGAKLGAGIVKE